MQHLLLAGMYSSHCADRMELPSRWIKSWRYNEWPDLLEEPVFIEYTNDPAAALVFRNENDIHSLRDMLPRYHWDNPRPMAYPRDYVLAEYAKRVVAAQ